ncbi:response regulator [candidate division TA06 bacterium]|nr:response regulator [candidate division TA06 bacterium]
MNTEKRILIFDSKAVRYHSLVSALKKSSREWDVKVVHRAKKGLNLLHENPCDCVLLQETGIPDRKGLRLLREIREIDGEVPIILLSQDPQLNYVLEALRLGIFDYIKKPYSQEEVIAVVHLAIEKHDLQLEKERLLQDLLDANAELSFKNTNGQEKGRDWDLPMKPTHEPDHLLSKSLILSMELLEANKGVALQLDRKSNRLIVKESIGFNGHFSKGSPYDINGNEDLGKVVSQGKPCFLQSVGGRLACSPLGIPPDVFGVIFLGRSWSFTEGDLKVLSVFAPLVPYALQGVRFHTELEATQVGGVLSLLFLLEAKDPELWSHATRVMEYSNTLAKSVIGLPEETIKSIKFAALLHDVGKIAKGNSCGDGVQKMTVRVVDPLGISEETKLILHHQADRFDGNGKSNCQKGEEIPIGARILAIADAYDEALSIGKTKEEVLEGLTAAAGTRFDPFMVERFNEMLYKTRIKAPLR